MNDDVPDLIQALAERFQDHGFQAREALSIACEMLEEAMNDPEAYELQLLSPYIN